MATDTKSRILETTWELMELQSGKGVRMSDIAKASNLSRQSIYLHFENRTDLLVATTEYIDHVQNVDERMQPTLQAKSGHDRLNCFIAFWGSHLPQIYGIAKALLTQLSHDDAAAKAWENRMKLVRDQCEAIVKQMKKDNCLADNWTIKSATDMLFACLPVQVWEVHTQSHGWSEAQYIKRTQTSTARMLMST